MYTNPICSIKIDLLEVVSFIVKTLRNTDVALFLRVFYFL